MTRAPRAKTQPPIRRLGRFTILEDLAKGGMAQVYVAQKDGSPEICVLKQLLLELETHATAGKRFYREAHVASYLIHPRIARTTDAGFEDGAFCIAMEFISGRDVESIMHHLMRQGRMLPYQVSISIALDALDGLAYAHDATDPEGARLDLVHRDLSPRNLMLGFDGDVRIIDFGLARGRVDDFKTAPGMVLGTLRYVSPEQAVADPVDHRSDLYSLGVVLHEMLTGRPLVPDGKPLEVLTTVVNETPPLLSALNPHLPRALDDVVARALAKDPKNRWQSAGAFRRALLDAAGELADVPRESLGEFVRSLFPEDERHARELLARGRQRYLEQSRGANGGLEPPMEVTRAADADTLLGDPADPSSETRTGFVEPIPLQGTDDLHVPTRSAVPGVDHTLAEPTYVPTVVDPRGAADGQTEIRMPTVAAMATEIVDRTLLLEDRAVAATTAWMPRIVRGTRIPPARRRTPLPWLIGVAVTSVAVGVIAAGALVARRQTRELPTVPLSTDVARPSLEPQATPGATALRITPAPAEKPSVLETPNAEARTESTPTPAPVHPRTESKRPGPREQPSKAAAAKGAEHAAPPAPPKPARGPSLKAQAEKLLQGESKMVGFDKAVNLLQARVSAIEDKKIQGRLSSAIGRAERNGDPDALIRIAGEIDEAGR
ncbi:MAG: serine/threonine protein kinase [Deltaproteobacteria bacterium]|nr:serine/threonine protein kinase [Deltaproteobacteria bacterium]